EGKAPGHHVVRVDSVVLVVRFERSGQHERPGSPGVRRFVRLVSADSGLVRFERSRHRLTMTGICQYRAPQICEPLDGVKLLGVKRLRGMIEDVSDKPGPTLL